MFHFRFHQIVIGALLLVTIGVRGAAPICTGFPSAKSDDCSKLINKYIADNTTATIDGTGHAAITSNSCAVAVIPNGYVERITNDYLALHGLSIYDACGNGASMAGFQTDDYLPTICVLSVNSVSRCGTTGINGTQTAGSPGSYKIPLASSLYISVGILLSRYF